jgi:hypothetical protein
MYKKLAINNKKLFSQTQLILKSFSEDKLDNK